MPKHSLLSGRAFDAGLAALAAVSAGFVAFAMPESLFSGLVEASRLPDFVPAAEPPLGETARLAATGAASLLTFGSVWGLMALLGRVPAGRKAQAQPEAEAPKIRRADAHPDAPARRPLLARDLGEPLELDEFPETAPEMAPEFAEVPDRALPAFLVPQPPEADPVAEAEPHWEEPEIRWDLSEPEPAEAEAEPQSEPQSAPQSAPQPEAEPDPEPEVEAEAESLPISELAAQLPDSREEPDQPLSQLVNRIEFGLSRKRQALPAAMERAPADEAPADQEKVGHRLRSAINDLQKIASTGS